MIKRILVYKNAIMKKVLKQSLGIDVSKLNLSLSLGFLTDKLVKEYKVHCDVSNDITGYKELLKWLKSSVDESVDLLVVMEATGVFVRADLDLEEPYESRGSRTVL